MSRIQKAYETRFRWLLERVHARRLDAGVQWLVDKARKQSAARGVSFADALTQIYEEIAALPRYQAPDRREPVTRFICDAGLGGLARWLRAAGYDTSWEAGIDDDALLREARRLSAEILTTDSMLMERRLIRDRIIPGFWLPPTLTISEQLRRVFKEYQLTLRERRCMTCGGELVRKDKESLKDRIPPRTYRWRDEYFVCNRCGKLFWHGTHWERIHHELERISEVSPPPSVSAKFR